MLFLNALWRDYFSLSARADYYRTSRRIQGEVLVQRAVVFLVEDIVYADARFDDKVAEAVEGMAGIEVPDA